MHLAPLVSGWIEFDNREGRCPVRLIFGVGNGEDTLRPLDDTCPELAGFAGGVRFGYATRPGRGVALRQGFDVLQPKFLDYRGLHVIAGESALVFTVPAGQRRRFPLALGFYAAGPVTSGLEACYAYTRWFRNLEDVLIHGLQDRGRRERVAARRDRELERSQLSPDQKFLLAQATHSYLGSTQLLWHQGKPLWVVNEGEYRMINTFDLTVDQLFFELRWHPWAVRNALDLFVRRYSYTDEFGLSFVRHGVNNHFTPPGRSSYGVTASRLFQSHEHGTAPAGCCVPPPTPRTRRRHGYGPAAGRCRAPPTRNRDHDCTAQWPARASSDASPVARDHHL
jgi:hypothetical protein